MFLTIAIECNSLREFLEHWSAKYPDPSRRDTGLYDPYVGKPLTEESRRKLFEWKNGSRLSDGKSKSVEAHYPLSPPPGEELASKYLDARADGGAIWNIFYMHCVAPQMWPIFDQHTFRAMSFMKTGAIEEIPSAKAKIYEIYKDEYVPFVNTLAADQRTIDKALYTFGQFLKIVQRYRVGCR